MLKRRRWMKLVLFGTLAFLPSQVRGQQGLPTNRAELNTRNVVDLEDQLKNGLRAVTPGQVRYIKTVVALVKNGRLPRAMVNLVYRWAIKRNSSVPLPYFQYALRVLAERRGIAVP